MKITNKLYVKHSLTSGKWGHAANCRKAGETFLDVIPECTRDADYISWYGHHILLTEIEVTTEVNDELIKAGLMEAATKEAEAMRQKLKELEAKFYVDKSKIEAALNNILLLTHQEGDDAKEVSDAIEGDLIDEPKVKPQGRGLRKRGSRCKQVDIEDCDPDDFPI